MTRAREDHAPIVVASNRGPVAFVRRADGSVVEKRGLGGLVTAVQGAVHGRRATWVAAAITEDDHARAAGGPFEISLPEAATGSLRVRLADIDPPTYDGYYNDFSNRLLWFLHHDLWERPLQPSFGAREASAWESYRQVNQMFADMIVDEADDDAIVLPQDYHLCLVPGLVRKARPDVAMTQFWHIPWCSPEQYRALPDAWGRSLLEGMLQADLVGFHTDRWASNFLACCREVLGARIRGHVVTYRDRTTRVGAHPIGVDEPAMRADAFRPEIDACVSQIRELAGDRTLILRVDRTDLSKNILRGFLAYERLLDERPDLHERIVHLALLTPSRSGVAEYQDYLQRCLDVVERVNDRFARPGWQPLVAEVADDFPRTLAAYRCYDVLLVNPVYDGMNLVAREGPILNERDGVLVLSRNAGAAAELERASLIVNPFDTEATAAALAEAIDMPSDARAEMAERLRALAVGTPPQRWLEGQIRSLRRQVP